MISYELALKLKEAGFPEPESVKVRKDFPNSTSWVLTETYGMAYAQGRDDFVYKVILCPGYTYQPGVYVYVPTLAELIEACGEDFIGYSLEHYSPERWRCVKWITHLFQCKDGVTRKGCLWEGETWGFAPEEAVANFYLAIHKQ